MKAIERAVTLHPYFKVHPGQMNAAKALLREFVTRTAREEKMLYYEFMVNDDVVFCREGYAGAEGALAHLANVDDLIKKMLTLSTLARLEIHGPAEELEKLKGPAGGMNPTWFAYECGVQR